MNPPNRPNINLEPRLSDYTEQAASNIVKAEHDLFECAFRTNPGEHTHLMEQAHTAPQVLAHAIHELFYLRRQVEFKAARAADAELADSQRPLADRCRAAIAAEARCATAAPTVKCGTAAPAVASPRPPTIAELERELATAKRLYDERGRRLDDVEVLTRMAAGTCQQLNKADLLGVLGLANAIVHRQPPDERNNVTR